ncbi:hypothetical protein EHM69_11170 [candidate division KSB1 bacterium]|nr:MAG: hypothetical protein EHM69_11170 [candidate division KSB1 bacterium]
MPKTKRGKNRSRMNAFKHGLRATDELFLAHLKPSERETFRAFRESLHAEYDPLTDHEKLLVDHIAIQHFRLYRLYRLEYQSTNRSTRASHIRESIIPHLDRFSRYDSRIGRQLRVLHNRLNSLYVSRKNYSLNTFLVKE